MSDGTGFYRDKEEDQGHKTTEELTVRATLTMIGRKEKHEYYDERLTVEQTRIQQRTGNTQGYKYTRDVLRDYLRAQGRTNTRE